MRRSVLYLVLISWVLPFLVGVDKVQAKSRHPQLRLGYGDYENSLGLEIYGQYSELPQGKVSLQGPGWGTLRGFGLGLIPGVGMLVGNCHPELDAGPCEQLKGMEAGLFVAGSAATGALVGGLVGLAVPKNEKISIIPSLQRAGVETQAKMQVGFPF